MRRTWATAGEMSDFVPEDVLDAIQEGVVIQSRIGAHPCGEHRSRRGLGSPGQLDRQ